MPVDYSSLIFRLQIPLLSSYRGELWNSKVLSFPKCVKADQFSCTKSSFFSIKLKSSNNFWNVVFLISNLWPPPSPKPHPCQSLLPRLHLNSLNSKKDGSKFTIYSNLNSVGWLLGTAYQYSGSFTSPNQRIFCEHHKVVTSSFDQRPASFFLLSINHIKASSS